MSLDSGFSTFSKAVNQVVSSFDMVKSSPLVSRSMGHAKDMVKGGWSGITGVPLTRYGMGMAGGAIAGASYNYGVGDGRHIGRSAVKGALLGGLGMGAFSGIKGGLAGGRGLGSTLGAGFTRMSQAAEANEKSLWNATFGGGKYNRKDLIKAGLGY